MAVTKSAPRPAPRLPSAAQLKSGSNYDVCTVILEAIEGRGLHLPPNKTSALASSLWTPQGTGAFDGRFLPWESVRAGRNMRERVTAIFDCFGQYDQETIFCAMPASRPICTP